MAKRLQHPVPFSIPAEVLATDPSNADRFVYAPTLVMYDPQRDEPTVLRPSLQLARAAFYATFVAPGAITDDMLARYPGLAAEVERYRGAKTASARASQPAAVDPLMVELNERLRDAAAKGEVAEVSRLAATMAASTVSQALTPLGYSEATITVGGGTTHAATPVTTVTVTTPPPPPGGTDVPIPPPPVPPVVPEVQDILASELAILFLDRTRIRPRGFALGEHVYSLSLAPGEQVVLEEKTYSKREESFEESSEQEKTFDTEMSSTLTTELNEGMASERSRNSVDANSMGANIGGEIYGITFNVGPQSSSTVTDADRDSANSSVKTSHASSSKVAARNRAQHKTVMRITSESRFETSSQRTIRNPNPNTPIDIQYFKVMQRLELAHERYGVRLCWAPVVSNPGARLFARLEAARTELYARVVGAGAGPRPAMPTPPGGTTTPPRVITASQVADRFDPLWGGQSHDYIVEIPAPSGMQWNGDRAAVTNSLRFTFTGSRPADAQVRSVLPTPTGARAVVHVGVEDNANPFKPDYWERRGTATFTVSATFVAVPAPAAGDEQYRKDLATWRESVAQWEALDAAAKEAARAEADRAWTDKRREILAGTDHLLEVIGAIVGATVFTEGGRPGVRVVDFLEDVFDWKNASLRLYPGWWSSRGVRDPDGAPDSFVNAAWARLYLPVKPGSEAAALRWIHELRTTGTGSPETEALVTRVLQELGDFRTANFGGPDEMVVANGPGTCPQVSEKFVCLGTWKETVPTDGTHAEVMQATSSAADDYSREALADGERVRNAAIERARVENRLIEAAEQTGASGIDTDVRIHLGERPST
ncbi:MAG: hypothetical protein AB7V42_00165 [Thermoleophilia bacterium]